MFLSICILSQLFSFGNKIIVILKRKPASADEKANNNPFCQQAKTIPKASVSLI
jgi:hypothetical protein